MARKKEGVINMSLEHKLGDQTLRQADDGKGGGCDDNPEDCDEMAQQEGGWPDKHVDITAPTTVGGTGVHVAIGETDDDVVAQGS